LPGIGNYHFLSGSHVLFCSSRTRPPSDLREHQDDFSLL
jgi:hypothetical protein